MPRLPTSAQLFLLVAVAATGYPVRAQQAAPPAAIRPTENLIVEGIPEIPAGLADEVRRYTEARSAAFVGWHPLGLAPPGAPDGCQLTKATY